MAPQQAGQSAQHRGSLRRRLFGALAVMVLATVVVPAASSSAAESVEDELAAAYEEATALAQELNVIETNLATLEADIERFDAEIEDIRAELAELEDEVREIAVQRYVSAGNGPVTLGDDLLDHQRLDVMMSAVQRDSTETMDIYESAHERLESTTEALAGRLDDQVEARERMAERLADLDEELTRLNDLQRQADAEAARVAAEERQAAALSAATSTTRATTTTRPASTTTPSLASPSTAPTTTASTTTTTPTTTTSTTTSTTTAPDDDDDGGSSPPPSSSGFLCPVDGVSVFVDTWGAARSGGRQHKGVDMLAKTGTPTVAPVSGTVTHRGNSLGGLSYHLDGDDGNYYYGTHLSAYGAEGRVSAGTIIGYVGDSGNAAGTPHLHFEIHPGGRGNAINPYPTVKAACG